MSEDNGHGRDEPARRSDRSPLRMTAGLAAIPAGVVVACASGGYVWWFKAKYFTASRAAGFGLTLAVLVAGSLLMVAAVPGGRRRARVLAAVPAVWCVAAGVWIGAVWWGAFTGALLAGLGVVVVGGGGQVWVWWWQHGRTRTGRVAAATAALLLLIPVGGAWWLWHMSAHLGTAGEQTPSKAADAFYDDLVVSPVDQRTGSDMDRLVCRGDAAGRSQTRAYIDSWARYLRSLRRGYGVTLIWLGGHPRVDGDTAIIHGTLMMTMQYPDNMVSHDDEDLTVRLVREDGWRVCGFPGLHIPRPDSSRSTSPSPAPTGPPSRSPSPTDGGLVNGAPSDMQKCAPNDPYRHLGWYTCPPN